MQGLNGYDSVAGIGGFAADFPVLSGPREKGANTFSNDLVVVHDQNSRIHSGWPQGAAGTAAAWRSGTVAVTVVQSSLGSSKLLRLTPLPWSETRKIKLSSSSSKRTSAVGLPEWR